jgi:hypothetical protein
LPDAARGKIDGDEGHDDFKIAAQMSGDSAAAEVLEKMGVATAPLLLG